MNIALFFRRMICVVFLIFGMLFFVSKDLKAEGGDIMNLELISPAFNNNQSIPQKYTCEGEDISPPLEWKGVVENVKSFVLIADDPDAPMGTWVHWVIYNIPSEVTELKEGIPAIESLDDGTLQGITDFNRIGYGGPCPPPGKPHRYYFKLYALDTKLQFSPGATKKEVEQAIQGNIIDKSELIGLYSR